MLGAVCLLLFKFAALSEGRPDARPVVLLVIPAESRAAMIFSARACPCARPGPGLGRVYREGLTWRHVIVAGLVAVLASGACLGLTGLALVALSLFFRVMISWLARRHIPGLTSDVYGVINELVEVGALLCLPVLWGIG